MSQQIAVRVPDELLAELDRLVESGLFPTKASAIRSAIEDLVETERRRRIGEAIVEGYRRLSESDEEIEEAHRASVRSIEEEPW